MSESESKNMLSVPKWDGRTESCPRYLVQLEALSGYYGCRDVLDETAIVNFPTKAAYTALDKADDVNKPAIGLYQSNKNMVAIMTLGQGSDHGLAVIKKTKSVDHLNGLLHRSIVMLMKKNKSKDASAEIELEAREDPIVDGE